MASAPPMVPGTPIRNSSPARFRHRVPSSATVEIESPPAPRSPARCHRCSMPAKARSRRMTTPRGRRRRAPAGWTPHPSTSSPARRPASAARNAPGPRRSAGRNSTSADTPGGTRSPAPSGASATSRPRTCRQPIDQVRLGSARRASSCRRSTMRGLDRWRQRVAATARRASCLSWPGRACAHARDVAGAQATPRRRPALATCQISAGRSAGRRQAAHVAMPARLGQRRPACRG